jgi:hypothetical protein
VNDRAVPLHSQAPALCISVTDPPPGQRESAEMGPTLLTTWGSATAGGLATPFRTRARRSNRLTSTRSE